MIAAGRALLSVLRFALGGPWQYARARSVGAATGVTLAMVAVGGAVRGATAEVLTDSQSTVPWAVLLPVALAVVTSVSMHSSAATVERLSARHLGPWRLAQLAWLTAIDVLGTILVAGRLPPPIALESALRNLLAFTGAALLAAVLLGPRLSWLAPAGWAMLTLTVGSTDGRPKPWALALQPDAHTGALLLSAAIFTAGLVACATGVMARWARPAPDDID